MIQRGWLAAGKARVIGSGQGRSCGREARVGAMTRIREVVRAARPADPEFAAALARRWAELPETARTPAQLPGRHAAGCEGTHGGFPQCDLASTPRSHPPPPHPAL